jgi:rod shape-determining protein MreC
MSPGTSAWRRGVFVFLIIASLALLTVSFRESESGPVHEVRQAFASLLSPLQSFGARVAEPFQDGYEWFKNVWSAQEKAKTLQEQLQVLQGELIRLQEQAEENERLKSFLELRDRGTYPSGTNFEVAQVIGKSPNLWERWILIDRGTNDGIAVGQSVVGATPTVGESVLGKGLVGRVVAANATTAKIQLITDSESSVAAKIQGARAEGIVHGSLQGDLTMDYVDRDLAVDPKLVVVTSGYGGVYPADIPVGIVSSVGEETINIYKEIEVQAFVDFRVLEDVMVLIPSDATATPQTTTTLGTTTTQVQGTAVPQGSTTTTSATTTTVGAGGR